MDSTTPPNEDNLQHKGPKTRSGSKKPPQIKSIQQGNTSDADGQGAKQIGKKRPKKKQKTKDEEKEDLIKAMRGNTQERKDTDGSKDLFLHVATELVQERAIFDVPDRKKFRLQYGLNQINERYAYYI